MGTILAIGAALLLTGILAARIYNGRKKPGSPGQRGQIPPRPKPPSRRRSFYERGPGGAGAPPLKNKRSKSERGGLFSGKLKIAAPALAGLVLLLWLGVSLLNSGTGKDEDSASLPAAQAAGPGAQPQKADPLPAPSISVKIAPPPDKVENPVIFDIETAEASPASDGTPTVGPTTPGTPGPADFSPQPATLTEGAKASAALGPMGAGAAEISPIISRMEPLGRYFDPEKPVPRAQPITPPDKTAEDDKNKPKTKRLSPPPPQEQKLTPPKPLPAAGERRYTIIVGSFSKEENALKLKQKLEDEGLPAEVVPVMNNGQPWWRVMSGVFEDRESAEAYRRELRQKNMDMPYVKAL